MSGDAQQSTESHIPDGRRADLLPTGGLLPERFEDFTEDLLNAYKFVTAPARQVQGIHRWGRRGDKQDGIDFEGTWSDGTTAAWQCKRLDNLTDADVRAFIAKCTFEANEYYIVYSGEASSAARREVKKHGGWDILDQRDLTQMLKALPPSKQRQLLEAFWGATFRRLFVRIPGLDSFLGIEEIAARRHSSEELLNDLGPTAGRAKETADLSAALARTENWPRVVIISGIGGIGKTRLMAECLEGFQAANSRIQVLWLSLGRNLDKDAIDELPLTPAVVVVDDAHRSVMDLGILLNYAKENPETQIVLGVRGLESQLIRHELLRAGFRQDEIREIAVRRLSLREGRSLVDSLADGLGIHYGLSEALARQACEAPFLAVLTLSMIRRGQLTGHLTLDANLREQVMARYESILLDGVDAVEPRPLNRVLAALSALGTADINDEVIRARILELARVELSDYLQLRVQLVNHGILMEQGGRARIVPELFADQILERVSVIGGVDSGFVAELWRALGDVAREDLFTSIGSLEWRLVRLNGPSVMNPVWASIETTIDQGSYETLYTLAGHLGTLPLTQPVKTVELLRRIQQRLDELDHIPPGENPHGQLGEAGIEALFEPGGINRAAVERRLALPYGACAANGPEILEQALDALWGLGRCDPRPVNSTLDHPCKIIIDQLCDVSRLPDPSYPERIITAAGRWLEERHPDDVITPLVVVEPLLGKEGTSTEMNNPRALSLSPFLVNPTWARPLRDAVRALCVKNAGDDNLPLTAEIIKLLEGAARPPVGMLGAQVNDEQRNAWADDDLATIATLRTIAESTGKAVVRRAVRHAAEIPAGYATSPQLKYAALSLVHGLDQLEGDDLSDFLLGGERMTEPGPQRGRTAPLLSECVEMIGAGSSKTTEDEDGDDFDARWDEHNRRAEENLTRLVDLLCPPNADAKAGAQRLNAELHDALLMSKDTPRHQLITLVRQVVKQRPEAVRGILEAIVELSDGPLDVGIPNLLDGLQHSDRAFVDSLVSTVSDQREGVRWAVGRAAAMFAWAGLGTSYNEAITRGTTDPADHVRQEFLAALPFSDDPIAVSKMLIEAEASDNAVGRVLRTPIDNTDKHWYRTLERDQASAVLDLIAHLKVGTWEAENRIADIAASHPRLVLDRMSDTNLGGLLRNPTYGDLRAAFSECPGEIADWIIDGCTSDPGSVAAEVDRIVGERLPSEVVGALIDAADDLDQHKLMNLLGILAQINAWAAHHIDLARRLVQRSRAFGQDTQNQALRHVRQHLAPTHWIASGSESPQLHAALVAVEAALESEMNEDLRALETEARQSLSIQIEDLRREFEEEND